ncbi:hypothetical protein GCM10020331_084040 [Ectobacillus funiculus]
MPGTPNWVILSVFMIAIAYALFSGIEVIARLGEIIFACPISFIFLVEIVLVFLDRIRSVSNDYSQFLGEGWDRVWEGAWPSGAQQSFAETLEFAMIWTLTKQPERIAKTTILATLLYGTLLSTFDALAILTFGEEVFFKQYVPLIQVSQNYLYCGLSRKT